VDRTRKKVLLVEDDVAPAEMYRGVLRLSRFDARHVSGGLAALQFLEGDAPDLIVLDMNLPVLQGGELLREIAQRPELRQIPAIVVTGADIPSDLNVSRQSTFFGSRVPPTGLCR
jgi:CheY-like chemotaxis protein